MNPILDCLRATVERFPERIAVADAKRSYSFRALWHEAACLAARIAQRGRGIGVLVERGAETAVLFLAVRSAAIITSRLTPRSRRRSGRPFWPTRRSR